MPTRAPWPWRRRTRNTVLLLTVDRSIGRENGMDRRGWRLKPSSVLMTSISAQSDGRPAQSGLGSVTRTPVFWSWSSTVKRSLGNGLLAGLLAGEERSKSTSVADASPGSRNRLATAMATMRTLYCGLMRRPLHNHDGTARVESTTRKTAQTYHARISVSIGLKSLDFSLLAAADLSRDLLIGAR